MNILSSRSSNSQSNALKCSLTKNLWKTNYWFSHCNNTFIFTKSWAKNDPHDTGKPVIPFVKICQKKASLYHTFLSCSHYQYFLRTKCTLLSESNVWENYSLWLSENAHVFKTKLCHFTPLCQQISSTIAGPSPYWKSRISTWPQKSGFGHLRTQR